jgi:hypothetical protein
MSVTAITPVRELLNKHPNGLRRDQVYTKLPSYTIRDVDIAIAQLKQAGQVVELGSGRSASLMMADYQKPAASTATFGKQSDKDEGRLQKQALAREESKPVTETKPASNSKTFGSLRPHSDKGAVAVHLYERQNDDGTWIFMSAKEIAHDLSGIKNLGYQLCTLAKEGYLEQRGTRGSFKYGWSGKFLKPYKGYGATAPSPVTITKAKLENVEKELMRPGQVILLTEPAPAVEALSFKISQDLLKKIRQREDECTESFLDGARKLIMSMDHASSVELARLEGRILAIQEVLAMLAEEGIE